MRKEERNALTEGEKIDIESVVQSLIGTIPDTALQLEELREDKLRAELADSGTTYLNWLEQIREYCVRHQVEEDIRKHFYMETVLVNIWCPEDGEEMNRRELELASVRF